MIKCWMIFDKPKAKSQSKVQAQVTPLKEEKEFGLWALSKISCAAHDSDNVCESAGKILEFIEDKIKRDNSDNVL